MNKKELLIEYGKCITDYSYYARKYAIILDETVGKKVHFKLFKQQKELIDNLNKFTKNIVPKSRQSGISTTSALYAALYMMFNDDRKVCIVAHKRDGAENFLAKVKEFINDRPEWLGDDDTESGIWVKNQSQSRIVLSNGSEARAFASSSESLRSFTPTFLIMDECAFIPNARKLWTAAAPTLSTGGMALFISTPNGQDALFYKTYEQALIGESEFNITYIRWWRDKRYNKGLKWVKGENEIFEEEDEQRMFELFEDGYKPTSPWFESQKKMANNDKKKIAQEYEIEFLGSSSTVVESEVIQRIQEKYVLDKKNISTDKRWDKIHYFRPPIEGEEYIMGVDVSSGNSDDKSAIALINSETMEICAEYCEKVTPDLLAHTVDYLGRMYNDALAVVDVQGGYGETTILELKNLNYKNIYQGARSVRSLRNGSQEVFDGFLITTSNRPKMVEKFRTLIRKDEFIVESPRLLSELKTFIYKESGKAEHMKGYHDDIIMSYMMILYVLTSDYETVKKNNEKVKKMLSAMANSNIANYQNNWNYADNWLFDSKKSIKEEEEKKKKKFKLPKHGFLF